MRPTADGMVFGWQYMATSFEDNVYQYATQSTKFPWTHFISAFAH